MDYMQIIYHFSEGTWASSDFAIQGGILEPSFPQTTRDDCIYYVVIKFNLIAPPPEFYD